MQIEMCWKFQVFKIDILFFRFCIWILHDIYFLHTNWFVIQWIVGSYKILVSRNFLMKFREIVENCKKSLVETSFLDNPCFQQHLKIQESLNHQNFSQENLNGGIGPYHLPLEFLKKFKKSIFKRKKYI